MKIGIIRMGKTKVLSEGKYEYQEDDKLGKGSFATVYRGVMTETGRPVAIRLLPLDLVKEYGNKIKEIIEGEVSVLKTLSYSEDPCKLFTTRIFDCFMTERNVYMVMEICKGGTLEEVLKVTGAWE